MDIIFGKVPPIRVDGPIGELSVIIPGNCSTSPVVELIWTLRSFATQSGYWFMNCVLGSGVRIPTLFKSAGHSGYKLGFVTVP